MLFLSAGIIGLFLATMVPCSIMQLIGVDLEYGSTVYTHLQQIVTVLVTLNFSGNFLLYCLLNHRFWVVAKTVLKCQGKRNRVSPQVRKESDKIQLKKSVSGESRNGNMIENGGNVNNLGLSQNSIA